MNAAIAVPATVTEAGTTWIVSRAWPDREGDGVDLEVRNDDTVDVRGGHWSSTDGARLLPSGTDARLPKLATVRHEGRVLVHRPGRRAVVRADDGASYVKLVRAHRAHEVLAAHEYASGFGAAFTLPTLLPSSDERAGVLRLSALPGRTVLAVGRDPTTTDTQWRTLWSAWADGWRQLPEDAPGAPVHSPMDEADGVARWAGHAVRATDSRAFGARILEAGARIGDALCAGPIEPLVLSHRDLHDKQMLWSAEGLALIDLDTAARAEAALDLGNLRAHLRLRIDQGVLSPDFAAIAAVAIADVANARDVSPQRIARYEDATQFRLNCLHLFRPAWRSWASRSLAEMVDRILAS